MADYRRIVSGWSTLVLTLKALCRLQNRYGTKIMAWAASKLSPADFATFSTWFNALAVVCLIVESAPDD